jgi:hypothetical protein
MTDQVNGNARAGSFLSGQPQWWSFATLVPVGQTNVDTPVVDLPGYQVYATLGTWTNITISGVTYTSLNQYLNAFYQQQNYNILVNTFAGRGNPVQVGISTLPATINGGAINPNSSTYFANAGYNNNIAGAVTSVFGSSYNATATYPVYVVTISTEKNNVWESYLNNNFNTGTTADNTNNQGYLVLSNNTLYGGLDGLLCYDNQSGQALSGSSNSSAAAVNSTFATTNTVAPYVNTFITSSASLTNTMAALTGTLPGGLI